MKCLQNIPSFVLISATVIFFQYARQCPNALLRIPKKFPINIHANRLGETKSRTVSIYVNFRFDFWTAKSWLFPFRFHFLSYFSFLWLNELESLCHVTIILKDAETRERRYVMKCYEQGKMNHRYPLYSPIGYFELG